MNYWKNLNIPFKIAAIYFVFSFLWILFSDKVLLLITTDPEVLTSIQTYKGWFFISISAVIIFLLIQREIKIKNKLIETINSSEQWHSLIASNIPNTHVFLFDDDNRIILCKGSVIEKYGFRNEDIQGKRIHEMPVDNIFLRYAQLYLHDVLIGKNLDKEVLLGGDWFEIKSVPVKNRKEEIIAGIILFTDINLRKEHDKELNRAKEQAEESDRLKSAFLANISHEVRTPLNGLVGFSEILASSKTSDKQKEKYHKIIKSSGKQLLRIIEDLLDISRIEVNQVSVHKTVFTLNKFLSVIKATFDEYESTKKKGLVIRLNNFFEEEKDIVYADKTRLQQVLSNLLSNATKFTEQGTIELGYSFSDNKSLLFYVKDSGIGIPPDKINLIFERFRQVEETSHLYPRDGSGLGLAISKGLVTAMGGQIWVESERGKGSTFYFTIPYYKDEESEHADEPDVLYEADADSHVLFLNLSNDSLIIKEYCKEHNISLIHSLNVNEAVDECLNNEKIIYAVIEHNLPIVDGLEIARTIKRFRDNIEIVILSDGLSELQVKKAKECGVFLFLNKPFSKNEFLKILKG